MYNFSIGGSKKDPYNFQIGGSSSGEPKKGFGLTGSLSKGGGLSGGLQSNLMPSQTKKPSSSYTSGFGGGFGDSKSIQEASKSAQSSKPLSNVTNSTTAKGSKAQPQKKNAKSKFGEDIIPRRFGLRYDPPTITLEYMEPNSGKLYHHKMKLKKLQKDTNIKDAIEYLRKKHETYLCDETVSDEQLKALIERLQKRLSTATSKPADKGGKIEPPKKSNSLTPLTNNDFKSSASSGSQGIRGNTPASTAGSSQIRSSSATNAKSTTASSSTAYGGKPSYLKSKDDDYESEDVFKYAWNKKGAGSIQSSKVNQQDEYDYYNDEDDEDEEEDDYKIDYNSYNLNKLSNEELQRHKNKMEVLFKQNSLKPGDKGYQYNVEEDFDPEESNDWDDDV